MADVALAGTQLPEGASYGTVSLKQVIHKHGIDGPTCHVGSLLNKGTTEQAESFRRALANMLKAPDFIGIDLFPGPNVDVVGDLCDPDFFDAHPDLEGRFGFVYCRALLEHVKNPFDAARTIQRLIRPGGHLYVSGPWVWGYHPYPDDYWRISFSGLKALFPGVTFDSWWYSGTVPRSAIYSDDLKIERLLFANRSANSIKPTAALISDRSMPYLNVEAVGRRA